MHESKGRPRAQSAKVGGKRGQNGSSKKGPLRYLDLSFEGHRPSTATGTRQTVLNNGFRPHGGHRGTKKFPLSPYTAFSQSVDQLDQYEHERSFDGEHCRTNSPAWTMDVYKEEYHSADSPLFVHKLLSPSRLSQQFDPGNYPQAFLTSHKRPPKKQYYRPNRTHQYLSATELRDCAKGEVDMKLGRPTRTTLLRARQRCSSAPVNAYEARRDIVKKLEERCESKRSGANLHSRDGLSMCVPNGESLHSYLTGARYNRAHCLDAKSMLEYGIYMPRDNPLACFIMKRGGEGTSRNKEEAPPASPASVLDGEDEESFPFTSSPPASHAPPDISRPWSADAHFSSPMVPPQPPSSPHPRAWEDRTQVQVDIGPASPRQEVRDQQEEGEDFLSPQPVLETILDVDDALNVKGTGMGSPHRPRSARGLHNSRSITYPIRPLSAQMLPSVVIQGTSISFPGRSPMSHPTTPTVQIPPAVKPIITAPPSSLADKQEQSEKTEEKPVVKMEDKAVNVPSIVGEYTADEPATGTNAAEEEEGKEEVTGEDNQGHSIVEQGAELVAEERSDIEDVESTADKVEKETERPSTANRKKVRFADASYEGEIAQDREKEEIQEQDPVGDGPKVAADDSVVFFLTEDEEKKGESLEGKNALSEDAITDAGEDLKQDNSSEKVVAKGEELQEESDKPESGNSDKPQELGQGEGESAGTEGKDKTTQYDAGLEDTESG